MRAVHSPTCIQLRGYVYQELEEAQANSELEQLISILGAEMIHQDEDSVIARKAVDEVYEVYFKLLSGHDYCVFQAWATPIPDDHCAPFDQVREIVEHWLPTQLRRGILKGITPLFEAASTPAKRPSRLERWPLCFQVSRTWSKPGPFQQAATHRPERRTT